MEELFAIQPSNAHQSLLLRDSAASQGLLTRINRDSLLRQWTPMEFAFRVADERSAEVPGICTVYVSGVLAMRTDVKEALFCDACDGLEFLPITVDGEQWLLLNCLNAVTRFDESKSNVMRGLTGEIFMVLKLSVVDPMAQHCELFTLSHSNRMELFALPSFKRRVEKLHLKGITFRRVGEIA